MLIHINIYQNISYIYIYQHSCTYIIRYQYISTNHSVCPSVPMCTVQCAMCTV